MAIALGGCLRGEPAYGITEDTGGHITYILGAMRALARHGAVRHCEIVTRRFDAPELGAIHAEPTERLNDKLSITRIDSGERSYLSKECLARDVPAFTRALIAELRGREERPDVIHAHFADAAKVAVAVRDALGIPFIYTAHSLAHDKAQMMDGQCADLSARIAEEDSAIARADAIIGSSRDECERQLLSYPSADETRIHRVRPGIDHRQATDRDMAAACELIAPFLRHPERPIVLAIARPVEKKNLTGLVHAFAASETLRHTANLVILPGLRASTEHGEGEQVKVMRELVGAIDEHDLHGVAAYPRQHSGAQVRGLYALAARSKGVFVNPALTEPFGLTILEAAVHGLPVVATKHGGPADIVAEIKHGTLVNPRDVDEIACAIENMVQNTKAWSKAATNAVRNIDAVRWSKYAASFVDIAASIGKRRVLPIARTAPRKLLLCDIDNTLTGCRDAARSFARFASEQRDMVFGVATGRSLIEARRLIREWNLPRPSVWITSVGSEIYWERNGDIQPDAAFETQIGGDWNADAAANIAESLPGVTAQAGVDQRAYKRSYFAAGETAVSRIRAALSGAGIAARIVHSHEKLLDILPAQAGKGAAMRHVAGALGIQRDNVFVAGDSGNDLDMLEAAANAIVVANCEAVLDRLKGRENVYFARQPYAAGVMEGFDALSGRTGDLSPQAIQEYAA